MRHAVVIGGGIGGLLAAHALAPRFERITVLERHRYPGPASNEAPAARRGVPQSRCLHLLTAAGAAAFDGLAPGWRQELLARGATPFDAGADAAMRVASGWLPRVPSGITMYACSRSLLEGVLRDGLAACPQVRLREGARVLGLLAEGDGVAGVALAVPGRQTADAVRADLVVDASGAASALPDWLASLPGTPRAPLRETAVASGRQYVSRWVRLAPTDAPDWHCLSIAPSAATSLCSAMLLRAEDGFWGLVLLAPDGWPLPHDDETVLDFAKSLGDGELGAVLQRAKPASPIHRHGATSSRWRHYEALTAWPRGLVAIGDSACMLDPYHGLGMTATARGVSALARRLDSGDAQTDRRADGAAFQRELAALNAEPWQMATGHRPDGRALPADARHRLYDRAPSDHNLAHALLAVRQMLRSADSLKEVCRV